ncbi:MAG: Glu/Leu/Phe/Val dehydrogenase [Alphaproteobacteria bacterium]|uniref:Leu/Phe/Val dehydrogenase n=1 Tax=Maricaulis alexandrii TaxID=2570354 RepID=UPI001107D6E2|nr:Glu/Leu/Phe/Val dehydrogenase dimerization domain-containing protein [Maricaulis alexandrii]MCR9266591.1 Glu/Leu/Phe/Val dehydrogenase [Alphaproteobacteria bacterium]
MSVLEHPSFDNHEKVLFATDEVTGLKAIIGVHSTASGPACGGCRMWSYPNSEAALTDVLRLSQGMSYKNIMADLPIGGGKSVIMKPEGAFDRQALFEAFGRAVESLNGQYTTAEDVGVSPDDMMAVRRSTEYVVGLPEGKAASGDPSPVTADGVFRGIQVCAERGLGKRDLNGVKVAIQGASGHVGTYLAGHLAKAGADLFITDINQDGLDKLKAEYGATIVGLDEIYDQDVDIFAPCALGAVINRDTIDRIKAKIIAGAANNQLATREMGEEVLKRGKIYAPDYVINAGGIINVMGEIAGDFDPAWVKGKLDGLEATLGEILDLSADQGRPSNLIADELARQRIEEKRAAKLSKVA